VCPHRDESQCGELLADAAGRPGSAAKADEEVAAVLEEVVADATGKPTRADAEAGALEQALATRTAGGGARLGEGGAASGGGDQLGRARVREEEPPPGSEKRARTS
jgi:hypothetical protein